MKTINTRELREKGLLYESMLNCKYDESGKRKDIEIELTKELESKLN